MECLGQLCSIVPCLWDCSARHSAYIRRLEDNLNSLRNAMESLNCLSQDVRNKVHDAQQQQQRRLRNQVTGWLLRVEALEQKVNPILASGSQEIENKCVGSCCPKNCWSSYKLGKKVTRIIPEVRGLTDEGHFDDVADDILVAAPVDELPMEGPVVGFETKFQEVWRSIQDRDTSIIGLVGIGGVGKTTLLKQLNNEFSKVMHEFDLVIWIVVSKPIDLGRIQDVIRNKLHIRDHLWEKKSEDQRASLIYNKLKEKKFVVLLDDLWGMLKLSEVGIPIPQRGVDNRSKIVFTTRSEEVCRSLDAHKIIKVCCLPPNEALDLFISKAGEDVLKSHPKLQQLVKDVASECGGLPLALITIGRSMSGKTDPQQWKDAKRMLMTYPSIFPGVKGEIFAKLVFSYDSLPTPTLQQCFEYCSIFPEDHEIQKEELVRLWIAEGIIDEYGNIYDALAQGRQIIESLMKACLLEVGQKVEERVKMHDVIRDMALWLACERGNKKNKFLAIDMVRGGDYGLPRMTQLSNGEKVSLWGRGVTVKSLARLSFGSNLITLIISRTDLQVLPAEIFQSMKAVKVLDLSYNIDLVEIPTEIGCLVNLEYLNIVDTYVKKLPVEVKQLKMLRFLLLNDTTLIPCGVISNLWLLQAFHQQRGADLTYGYKPELMEMGREMLGELEGLEHIMYLSLTVHGAASFQILSNSPKLQSCIRELRIYDCPHASPAVLDLCTDGRLWEHLEELQLRHFDLPAIKLGPSSSALGNLRHVSICGCDRIQNVSSLVYIPNLCILDVVSCEHMVELIGACDTINYKFDDTLLLVFFSSLVSLSLRDLPVLERICPCSALPFPSLEVLIVHGCDMLTNLSFDSNTAMTTPPNLKIEAQSVWWENTVQWDSKETKEVFAPKFKPYPERTYTKDAFEVLYNKPYPASKYTHPFHNSMH